MVSLRRSAPEVKAAASTRAASATTAKSAQHDDAPIGKFIAVGGTRLHYLDRGAGTPIVLLHGNGSMIEDFVSSGIIEGVAAGRRVIAFDRPGFGYSERPRGRAWTPAEQANLLLDAFSVLGIEQPIVVAHSWGTLVAVSLALAGGPERVTGLVLLSGYYYPTPRADAMAMAQAAVMLGAPVVPLIGRLMAAGAVRRAFAPCAVPAKFTSVYPISRALWPSQIKAVAEEAAMMMGAAQLLSHRYAELTVPVHLIAGSDDRIVETEKHSALLHRQLANSTFHRVPGIGHMVHHAVPQDVVTAITAMCEDRQRSAPVAPPVGEAARQWLHIGESTAAPPREPATV